MRVLLTCGPIYSHFAPMVAPVAEAIREARHKVAVATGPSLAGDLDRLGLPYLSLPRMLTGLQRAADPDQARRLGLIPEEMAKPVTGAMFGRLFAGEVALQSVKDLLAVASEFQPDLVVRENAELGAYLFAEKVGVPSRTLDTAAMAPSRHADVPPVLNESRTAFGLRPVPDTATLLAYPWVSWLWGDPGEEANSSSSKLQKGRVMGMSSEPWAAGSRQSVSASQHPLMVWQLLSAILLLVMGGIHLYLVFKGVGDLLGLLFVLNAAGGLVLATAIIVLRGRLLSLATVLSLLFMMGTLLALVLALTVGLFDIRADLGFQLVPTTLMVESIGTIVLVVTTALVSRSRRAA